VVVMAGESRLATVLRWCAFGLLAGFGLLGSLFVVGETMTDPGGVKGVLLVAAWLVPMATACVVCLLWPRPGSWVAGATLALIAGLWAWYAVAPEAWDTFMDDRGPVIGIATFALGLPLAFLGLHEPRRAGWMLLLAGVIPIVGTALEITGSGDSVGRGGLGGLLSTSGTIFAVPFVLSGALFLISGLLHRPEATSGGQPTAPIAAGSAPL
jgi:hypothetical protein